MTAEGISGGPLGRLTVRGIEEWQRLTADRWVAQLSEAYTYDKGTTEGFPAARWVDQLPEEERLECPEDFTRLNFQQGSRRNFAQGSYTLPNARPISIRPNFGLSPSAEFSAHGGFFRRLNFELAGANRSAASAPFFRAPNLRGDESQHQRRSAGLLGDLVGGSMIFSLSEGPPYGSRGIFQRPLGRPTVYRVLEWQPRADNAKALLLYQMCRPMASKGGGASRLS
jgi:hypothetical protein